ncbi:MAG: NAD(P)(+) transhydrogenase (Re/Si-specific) subunit beta [Proteobacteria bacterium]|nr:NAD(P)(+) transhydrogenase (Re/Si-specific) subunit beta [Pseudomonadota bacterium]NBX86478.1 NAD(P)(+) transhydrogenase (Re/Si-specific) subunit beta [Pseudomonadota bacterium]
METLTVLLQSPDVMALASLAAGVLFVLGLKGLSHPATARQGNLFAMVGMALAMAVVLLHPLMSAYSFIIFGLLIGAAIGIPLALKTPLTALPQLVAGFHSFIGLAAALVAVGMYLRQIPFNLMETKAALEMALGTAIGMVTFSGSVLAALKLQGWVSGTPWGWSGRHVLNLALGIALIACTIWFTATFNPLPLALIFILATIMGVTLVAPIGGADMPVVVSMLNSYSGWAAAATGFMLEQPLLIITGALVGASGAILSYIMCAAMHRSFLSVILGGFGNAESVTPAAGQGPAQVVKQAGAEDAAFIIAQAERVIIVPGYGMAVAQAQHAVKELFNLLASKNIETTFAIHPVAGRMPGHMNVLLAEADIPYDAVHELEDINPRFKETDVVLVLGANDVVNPAAQTTPGSPIYGMPVLEAWKAKQVYVVKRSHRPGYAGVDNPLFGMENCALVLGDAKAVVENITHALKSS